MKTPFLITEKVSWWDVVVKYTLRDTFFGILSFIPATPGIVLRMLCYRFILKAAGKGLLIRQYVTIKFPERIVIGDHVGISEYTLLDGDGGMRIGNYVRVASHVSVIAFEHNYKDPNTPIKLQGKVSRGIVIEDDCWIGTGARILDGVTIGKGSVIGAGSVVTESIPPYSIAVGVPAKVIKKRE